MRSMQCDIRTNYYSCKGPNCLDVVTPKCLKAATSGEGPMSFEVLTKPSRVDSQSYATLIVNNQAQQK